MVVTSPHEIRSRVDALLRDTQPLHTAAGLGFVADAKVVDDALASLTKDAWTVVDARSASNEDVRDALAAALKKARPIALALTELAPMSALLFAQAVADRKARVDLGDRVERDVPGKVSVVVLASGVEEHARLPRQLQRVDFWEFMP